MWLYDRDKKLSELEAVYSKATQDCFYEALTAAFEEDNLSDDELEQMRAPDADLSDLVREFLETGHMRRDAFDRFVNEDADSCVTYTADTQLMLLLTENQDALEDQTGESGSLEQQAAYAYYTDVGEWLSNDYTVKDWAEAHLASLAEKPVVSND